MKIAVGSDMKTHLTDVVVDELKKMGHEVEIFGALVKAPALWSQVAVEVAEKVSTGNYDQAVLFCWTGTGISLAANKVKGIRAALCHDAETSRGARKWNDANILAMSLRAVSEQVAKEILEAWFSTPPSTDREDVECIEYLKEAEERLMASLSHTDILKSEKK
ncbi:RpiB/LacA/LacB family sugar-phosphate isomerase [candidate division KSB1 bacterium]|nr:RpiB/LacA/LacB family sugar-phosphate isomerase [candidate division KSB1 bacterium]